MMFPMLNSLKLAFHVCYFVQFMHFLPINIRFLMDVIQDQLCEIAPSHNIRSPANQVCGHPVART